MTILEPEDRPVHFHKPDPDPVTLIIQSDLTEKMQLEIDHLPPIYKLIVGLYHQEEQSIEEIKKITGMASGTIKNYLFRARALLAKRLNEKYNKTELKSLIHPDETLLQEYVYEESKALLTSIEAHLHDCPVCTAKVIWYRKLKAALSASPLNLIDEEVLFHQIKPRLKAYKPVDYRIPWLFTLFIFCLGLLLFWTPDPGLRFNLPPVLIMVITCLLGFSVLEYRYTQTNYNRKINAF